jgi:2-polyprenyl-3-methyl-5-hydroxy-6-metoxy-1,4-benzoquinol methylase
MRYISRPPAAGYRPYFEFVASHARVCLEAHAGASILDIGCANGAFLHYMLSHFPKAQCTGIDAMPELVSMAASNVIGATFAVGDIQCAETLPLNKYSLVTMLTLHSHFDELDGWLDNTLNLVRPGGKALLFGPFNPKPVDVLVKAAP